MPTLTKQQILEIADQLDCGFQSFWHKPTGELLFVPDLNNYPQVGTEFIEEDFEKLAENT